MISYLRRNQQAFIVYIVLYSILIIFVNQFFFFKEVNVDDYFKGSTFFYFFNISLLSKTPPIIFAFASFLGILFIGFYIVRISINYLIIQSRSQFPALFSISIASFAFQKGIFSMSIIGAIFMLMAFDRLISSMEKQDINYRYIDGGILIAIGSLFYTNLLLFLPILWVSQVIIRKINTREVLFTIIGFLIPFIYCLSGAFLYDYSALEILRQVFFSITEHAEISYPWPFLVGISFYLAFTIFASVYAVLKFGSKKIQTRKLYQLLFYLFIIFLIIFFVIPSGSTELFVIASIPLSVLFSIYFTECKENIWNSLLLILLILMPIFLLVSKFFPI